MLSQITPFYPPGHAFPHYAFRIVGIVVLVIMVMIIYVASRSGCKGKNINKIEYVTLHIRSDESNN